LIPYSPKAHHNTKAGKMKSIIFPAFFWSKLLRCRGAKRLAEGWAAVAVGQTKAALPLQGRAISELRDSPTRSIIHEGFNPHFV